MKAHKDIAAYAHFMGRQKTPRRCETCRKDFRPITDAQWRHVKFEHDLLKERHPLEMREWFREEWLRGRDHE